MKFTKFLSIFIFFSCLLCFSLKAQTNTPVINSITANIAFSVYPPQNEYLNASPQYAQTQITINGNNLSDVGIINFMGVSDYFSFPTKITDTQITALTPVGIAQNLQVSVTDSNNNTSNSLPYFFFAPPVINSVTPNSVGKDNQTVVEVKGENFIDVQVVFVDNASTFFSVQDDNTMLVLLEGSTILGSGTITVYTAAGSGTKSNAFKYTDSGTSSTVITGISPTSGPQTGGTQVQITGNNFNDVLSTKGVYFGIIPATSYTIVSDTLITAIAPPYSIIGAGSYEVRINVVTPGNVIAQSNAGYTYTPGESPANINLVFPNSASARGKSVVELTGNNFSSVTNVYFDSIPATFQIASDQKIIALVPAVPKGIRRTNIVVENAFGLSLRKPTTRFYFIHIDPPTNFRVKQQSRKRCCARNGYTNILEWQAPNRGICPVQYNLYKDQQLTQLIGTVKDSQPTIFKDHVHRKGLHTYFLVAVDRFGQFSSPVSTSIINE